MIYDPDMVDAPLLLRVLGSAPPCPRADTACSGYLGSRGETGFLTHSAARSPVESAFAVTGSGDGHQVDVDFHSGRAAARTGVTPRAAVQLRGGSRSGIPARRATGDMEVRG